MDRKTSLQALMKGPLSPLYFCIGSPVVGNPTQHMMETAFDALGYSGRYLTIEVDPDELEPSIWGLLAMQFSGGNVTAPFKQEVLTYLDDVKNDPKSAVLLSGYQVDGSNGKMLMSDGVINVQASKEEIPHPVRIKCEVKKYDLSAHADQGELLAFIKACKPERVIIMHSDDREPMAEAVRQEGIKVLLPKAEEEVEL